MNDQAVEAVHHLAVLRTGLQNQVRRGLELLLLLLLSLLVNALTQFCDHISWLVRMTTCAG